MTSTRQLWIVAALAGCVSVHPVSVRVPESSAVRSDSVYLGRRVRLDMVNGQHYDVADASVRADSITGWIATRTQMRVRTSFPLREVRSATKRDVSAIKTFGLVVLTLVSTLLAGIAIYGI